MESDTLGADMQRAAIGIRAHSGWAAAVIVAGGPGAVKVLDRRKIVVIDPNVKGASQPYHFAKNEPLPAAERYLARCVAVSEGLALGALREILVDAERHNAMIVSCAILLAAGRQLPALERILASHALIHTAEGEFFRQCFRSAGERLKLRVTGIREKDLEHSARTSLGDKASSLKREIAELGRKLGPPWTADQKNACLAGLLALTVRAA